MRIKVGAVLTAAFVLLYEAVTVVAVVGEVMIGPEGGPESGISSSIGDDANHRRKTQKKKVSKSEKKNSKASNKVTKSEKKKIKKASKKAPTRSPTQPPTKPPTLQPTKNPTDERTIFGATDADCLDMLNHFSGIDDCYSLDPLHLMIEWDIELYDEGCRGVKYHILIAKGIYDYYNKTEEELIDIFSKDPNFHYEEQSTENYFYRKKLNYTGQHSAVVFAEIETGDGARAYSRSSKLVSPAGSVKPCIVSKELSVIKTGVVVVGPFVPTVNTTITVYTGKGPDGNDHTADYGQLIFKGPLGPEAKALQVGNIVTVATDDLDWHKFFIRGITTEDIGLNNQKMTFDVKSAQMADVFETYDANVNADVNKRDFLNYNYNCESEDADCEGRARRKLQRRVARRLGLWHGLASVFTSGYAHVKDAAGNLVTKTTEFIGDTINDVEAATSNVFTIATGQELNKSYRLVKIDKKWTKDFEDLITFAAEAKFDVDFIATFKVNSKYIVELKTAYEFTAEASLKKGNLTKPTEKTYPIGKLNKKFSKLFMIGPVPLEIYAQPKLEGQFKLDEFSLGIGNTSGPKFTYKGQTSATFGYDNGKSVTGFSGPNTLKKEFLPPKFDEVEITVDATMNLIFTADFGIYWGALKATAKLTVGPRLYAVGGARNLEDVTSSTSGRALLALPAESSDSAGIQNSRALISSTSTEPSDSINQVALMESPYSQNTDRHNLRILAPRSGESIKIFYIKTMNLDLQVGLILTGSALKDLIKFPEASLYTESFPIMRLPSVNITNDPISCVDGVPTASLVTTVDPNGGEPSVWISNDVKKDGATWYYSTAATEGWTLTSKENDKASLGFTSSSGQPTCPVGLVYYVVEAKFPPFLKTITEFELSEDNCDNLNVKCNPLPLGPYTVFMVVLKKEPVGSSVGLLDENFRQISHVGVGGDNDITCVEIGQDVIPQADEASGLIDKVRFFTQQSKGVFYPGSINCETAGKTNISKCQLSQSTSFPRNACVILNYF